MGNINEISNRTIVRILAITTAFVALVGAAVSLHRILTWVGIAFFLAVAVNPAVDFFARFMPRKNRGLAAAVVFALVIALFAFILVALVPPMVAQTEILIKKLPDLSASLQNSNLPIANLARKYDLVNLVKSNESRLATDVTHLGGSALDFARALASSFVATLTTLVITFFMILEGPGWLDALAKMGPKEKLKHRQRLATAMYHAVTGWVTGNLLTSLIAAVATSAVLFVVGIPFSIPLGLLVGLFDLLPLVGATLGAVVVIAVCLFNSLTAAIIMLIFFLVYQQLENHILQPLVYSHTVQLSPLLVLVSAIIGAHLGGLVGALVAIPLAASLQIVIRDYIELRAGHRV